MVQRNFILSFVCGTFLLCTSATLAHAQIGGNVNVGAGGGGVGVGVNVGVGGGGRGPSGAPLPLLGGTALGQAFMLGAGYLVWRRRKRSMDTGRPSQAVNVG